MRRVRVKRTERSAFVTFGVVADLEPEYVVVLDAHGRAFLGGTDGPDLGRVARGSRTWERRSRGNRYVNARGSTAEWHGWVPGSRSARPDEYADTRNELLCKLIGQYLHRVGKSRKVGA